MILNIKEEKNKKVYISESQCGLLAESEWNLHYGGATNGYGGKEGGHTLAPYKTDNKFVMPGRDTGHFGSGTYFSTYEGDAKSQEVLNGSMGNTNPNFIQIGDGVYRVDFDLYKNLYRVRTKRQGDVLFTMMMNLNRMYNKICRNQGKFGSGNDSVYDNGMLYQIIKRNAEGLGLRCPSYYQLTRMAQEHGRNDEAIQSFSTLFMEWNGYNGVNVSGVEGYDNTLHGSVIYDLSKTNGDMEEVSPKSLYTGGEDGGSTNSIVSKGYFDDMHNSMTGKDFMFYDKLNEMPLPQAMRMLKNYSDSGKILDWYIIGKLNDNLAQRYLRLIYVKQPRKYWYDCIADEFFGYENGKHYMELIEKYGAYYWVNYYGKNHAGKYVSGLVELLSNFDSNHGWWKYDDSEQIRAVKQEYLDKLMSYMRRDLEESEKKYIEEDYFYDWRSE